jgi:hypothetical protein
MEFERIKKKGRTWIIDIDGVIFEHNGYLAEMAGIETPLPGVKALFNHIPKEDVIVLVTARGSMYKENTIKSLDYNNIRFNYIIMDLPTGPRLLINDTKPDGTKTAFSYNLPRDSGISPSLLEKII